MPQLDQSGPLGQGPKTGKQRGACLHNDAVRSERCGNGRRRRFQLNSELDTYPGKNRKNGLRGRSHGMGRVIQNQ